MNITLENLGALRYAEFSLGEMTMLCGENNTGKTYATYALYGFLKLWERFVSIPVSDHDIECLVKDGSITIDLNQYKHNIPEILRHGCIKYSKNIHKIFAAHADKFKESIFSITINIEDSTEFRQYKRRLNTENIPLMMLSNEENLGYLSVTLLIDKDELKIPYPIIKQIIEDALKEILLSHFFPKPFIISAERTGAAIFRKELDFARNRLLEEIGKSDKQIDPLVLLTKTYQDYALPVKDNVDFTRRLESMANKNSFIAEEHATLLEDFADIIGGKYRITRQDELYFAPQKSWIKLDMRESSSAVRSLLDIGFYLRHLAKPGDILMIDEPELNLHPENQRRIARLLAWLVQLGVKVFITTHSDYLIKEFNTLIMLAQDEPRLQEIAQREGYRQEELITAEKIRVYVAENALIKLDSKQRKIRCQTLTIADIDSKTGIEARSFDQTITRMNEIQEEIIWG